MEKVSYEDLPGYTAWCDALDEGLIEEMDAYYAERGIESADDYDAWTSELDSFDDDLPF